MELKDIVSIGKVGLSALAVAGTLSLSGCGNNLSKNKSGYVTGTVVKEGGNLTNYNSANYGKGLNYAIQIQTLNKLYTAKVRYSGNKPLVALELAIHKGTKVKVEKSALEDQFYPDGIGYLNSNQIIVESSKK